MRESFEAASFLPITKASFIPGKEAAAERENRPKFNSAATPVLADEPVKERIGDNPEAFFMKQEGEVKGFINVPFQTNNPCPKRALKSPRINRESTFLKS
jgi:hypothetical protein